MGRHWSAKLRRADLGSDFKEVWRSALGKGSVWYRWVSRWRCLEEHVYTASGREKKSRVIYTDTVVEGEVMASRDGGQEGLG